MKASTESRLFSAVATAMLFPCLAQAVVIIENTRYAVTPGQIYTFPDGNTWEVGNGQYIVPCGEDSCGRDPGYRLAVGDTLRITTTLVQSLILTDTMGGPELFRGFFLRHPFPNHELALDVSSIETSARVTLFDASGGKAAMYSTASSMAMWEYEHFGGTDSLAGIENIIGDDFLSIGQSLEITGWLYEFNVISDPNGLLANSEWPWFSFGLKADSIQVGSHSVPEPGTLGLFGVGLVGVALARRRIWARKIG